MQELPPGGDMIADIIRQGKREMIWQVDVYLLKSKLQREKKVLMAAKVLLVSGVVYFSYNYFLCL